MQHSNLEVIFGPPGTGKTESLLSIVEELLSAGVSARRIAVLTFTKKAAEEAKQRAVDKFSIDPDELIWFRTIHSMVFKLLGLSRTQVVKKSDFEELGQLMGIEFQGNSAIGEDGVVQGAARGDKLVFLENIGRATGRGVEAAWEDHDHGCGIDANRGVSIEELRVFEQAYGKFKTSREIVDYTDMLIKFLREGSAPDVDVVIVDEGQDLSNCQWDVVEKIASAAKAVYIAGDDDQAIYRWAGAEVERFVSLQGRSRVLSQSFRMPRSIHRLSQGLVHRIGHRRPKQFLPREEEGSLNYATSIDEVDMSTGKWLLLARHVYQLNRYERFCRDNGWTYSVKGRTFADNDTIKAILEWEKLRKGQDLYAGAVKMIYRFIDRSIDELGRFALSTLSDDRLVSISELKASFGLSSDGPWFDVFDRIPYEEKQFYRLARKQGEKLVGEPRIKISTIHGAKGGQEDNVVVLTDVSEMTYATMDRHPDDEVRVFFVGVTRAKQNLFVLQPTTNLFFDV